MTELWDGSHATSSALRGKRLAPRVPLPARRGHRGQHDHRDSQGQSPSPALVPAHLPLGADEHHRDRPGPLRYRLVAAALEADGGPGRHHQRGRDRRVLSQQVPPAPAGVGARRARPLRRSGPRGPRRRHHRPGPHGLQPRPRGFLQGPSRLVRRRCAGAPYRAGEQYVSCINGPYYQEYLPDVLREIIERSHPEGFTDNSWSGLDRGRICYCALHPPFSPGRRSALAPRTTGTTPAIATGSSGATRAGSPSGTRTIRSRAPRAAPIASGWA